LDAYEIVSMLGRGGMGEVYRARDTRLERDVAVKVLSGRWSADPEAIGRLEREAKVLAALSHPNLLAVYDIGRAAGVTYVVTELLHGETLLDRPQRAWRKALEIAAETCDGLAAAHDKGIFHRDIKPGNIFLTRDGQVKLLDFGIAQMQMPALAPHSGDTAQGLEREISASFAGTLGYMAPEQLRGEPATAVSDIFSLGCVLYEMITGQVAFRRTSWGETVMAVLKEDPRPFPAETGVPAGVQRLVQRCVEKSPQMRIQSARDLSFHLRELLADPGPALAAAPRAGLESLAVLPFPAEGPEASEAEYLGDGIAESITNMLSRQSRLRVAARTTAFRFRGSKLDPAAIGSELRVNAVLAGRVVVRGELLRVQAELIDVASGAQLWGQRYVRKMQDILALEDEMAQQIFEALQVRLTEEEQQRLARRYTESVEAYHLYLQGRYAWNRRSADTLGRAIGFFQQAIEKDPGYALAYSGLADCYSTFGNFGLTPPAEAFPRAKAAARKALEIDDQLAEPYASWAVAASLYDWDWEGAERSFRRSIALDRDYEIAHHWFSVHLCARGRMEEAIAEFRRAEELDPLSLIILATGAMTLYMARRFDEALTQIEKCLRMDPGFVLSYLYRGWILTQLGRAEEAVADLRESISRSRPGAVQIAHLGYALARAGKRQEAERCLSDLDALAERRYVPKHVRATVWAGLGDREQTLTWLEQAFEERSALMHWLKPDPVFDFVRDDPRFQRLLAGMGLA
jgi:serine/threonine-protein kinase